jgi:GNAT superfamily N-acetyltransferase
MTDTTAERSADGRESTRGGWRSLAASGLSLAAFMAVGLSLLVWAGRGFPAQPLSYVRGDRLRRRRGDGRRHATRRRRRHRADAPDGGAADHATRRTLPTTLVLVDAIRVLGSVSLVLEDAPEFADEGSPWLASLYVRPDARRRGHGARLVRAAVAHAAALGIDDLYLFTPDHRGFYEQLGWTSMARTALKGKPVDLMCLAVATHGAEAAA